MTTCAGGSSGDEGARLLGFTAADADDHDVRVERPDD
jgi:hypothetical protein